VFGHYYTRKFIRVFAANNFKAYTAANAQPKHHKTVPASDNAPAPAVRKYRPNNDTNQTDNDARQVVTNTE
jgi:hypothetical protein